MGPETIFVPVAIGIAMGWFIMASIQEILKMRREARIKRERVRALYKETDDDGS